MAVCWKGKDKQFNFRNIVIKMDKISKCWLALEIERCNNLQIEGTG